jgi:hypothetical protein
MSTQIQTVEITMPKSSKVILTLEKYPVCPYLLDREIITEKMPSGSVYTWYPTGHVTIGLKEGKAMYFYPKPSMEQAVQSQDRGMYIRFFEDGSVEQTMYEGGPVYWWGPELKRKRVYSCEYADRSAFAYSTFKY